MSQAPHSNQKTRTITFGKIMLTLLVLGVFVVIGLLYSLYQTLTQTPTQTAANYQAATAPAPQVQVLSPDHKAGDKPVYRNANASAPAIPSASNQVATAESASEAAPDVDNAPATLANANALQSGDSAPKKSEPKKKSTERKNTVNKENDNNTNGERELKPTNVAPVAKGERELKPVPSTPRERPLTPKNTPRQSEQRAAPARNDAINDLF